MLKQRASSHGFVLYLYDFIVLHYIYIYIIYIIYIYLHCYLAKIRLFPRFHFGNITQENFHKRCAIFNPPVDPAPSSGWHLCIVVGLGYSHTPGFWISYVLPCFFPESLRWNSEDGRCNWTKTCSKRTCFVSIGRVVWNPRIWKMDVFQA